MWFKQGISLDDWNFDMENYYSLVDVKFLLKKILDSYWNKLLCKFCITIRHFHARVQSSTCTTYEKCNNGHANSGIGYTTTAFIALETGRKLNSVCWILLLAPFGRKNLGIVNWPIEGKSNMFLPDNCHIQKRTYILITYP